ncbi:TPA: glycosyltransferase family 2 protein [Aeromonas salmonicida]|nr:glycosyltransferase family 2 protein [Aeromonas salmonicida]
MFFSVIIPCYNSSRYIERCLDSILRQDNGDIEIIIINDGSTDDTLEKIKKFNGIQSIKIINKDNQGVSIARNVGLSVARGDYVVFIDSDDWVKYGYFSFCKKHLINSEIDILLLNRVEKIENKETVFDHALGEREHRQIDVFKASLNGLISNSPCDKIFARKSLDAKVCVFPAGVTVGEDALFFYRALFYAKKIKSVNEHFYVYMQDTGGVTQKNVTRKKIKDITCVVLEIKKLVPQSLYSELTIMNFKQLVYYYFNYFGNERNELNCIFRDSINNLRVNQFDSYKWKVYFLVIKSMHNFFLLDFYESYLERKVMDRQL